MSTAHRIEERLKALRSSAYFREPLLLSGLITAAVPLLAVILGYGLSIALLCTENARLARTVCRLGGTSGGALVETLLYPLWVLPVLVPVGIVLCVVGFRRARRTLHPAPTAPDLVRENIFIPKSLRRRRKR